MTSIKINKIDHPAINQPVKGITESTASHHLAAQPARPSPGLCIIRQGKANDDRKPAQYQRGIDPGILQQILNMVFFMALPIWMNISH